MITTDDRPVMLNQRQASICIMALVPARVPRRWEILLQKQKNQRNWLMWSAKFRGLFQLGVIYQMHTGTTMRDPTSRFFCFDSASEYQFVKCEGKAG